MALKRKQSMFIAAFLIGMLAIGGTVYGVASHYKYQNKLNHAKQEITETEQELNRLKTKLEQMVDANGFFTENLSKSEILAIKKQLHAIKDSQSDYELKKQDLKNEIRVIKINKQEMLKAVNKLERKMITQDEVNALFISDAIISNEVQEHAIRADLTKDAIKAVDLNKVKENTEWYQTMKSLIKDANEQIDTIQAAEKAVERLIQGDKVKEEATLKEYDNIMKVVKKIKNEEIRNHLDKKMNQALSLIEAEEKNREETKKQQVSGSSGLPQSNAASSGSESSGGYHQ